MEADLYVFPPRPSTSYRVHNHKGNTGHEFFVASNPPYGSLISYTLKSEPEEDVRITVHDAQGELLRELEVPGKMGFNRVNWDLRYRRPVEPPAEQPYFVTPPGWRPASYPVGPLALPGVYTATLSVGGREVSTELRVNEDPSIETSPEDRRAHLEATLETGRLLERLASGANVLSELQADLKRVRKDLGKGRVSGAMASSMSKVEDAAAELEKWLSPTGGIERRIGATGPPPPGHPTPLYPRINALYLSLNRWAAAPTDEQRRRIASLTEELGERLQDLDQIVDEEVRGLNALLHEHELPFISVSR